MESEELKKIVDELIELVKVVPEEYRQKTYEVLLTRRLLGVQPSLLGGAREEKKEESWDIELPIEVTAFLNAHGLKTENLKKLFVVKKGQVRESYFNKIDITNRTTAQIEVSLLTALEHALVDGQFMFSFEEIRERSKALGFYDKDSFRKPFKAREKLFNGFDDESRVTLSRDGKTELANVIVRITHEQGRTDSST